MSDPPRVFMSYSHDDQPHKDWALTLATRLVNNGVNVILDRWDLTLGSDLPMFMESGLVDADRVLAVCSENYVIKANGGKGGVGYEKMILTAQLMKDISSDRIIPVLRNNTSAAPPIFLSSKVYTDFRNDDDYEARYAELLRDIHGKSVTLRPALGVNPFSVATIHTTPNLPSGKERYVSPALSGRVVFDFSDNNGQYIVGSGDMAFITCWGGGSESSIYTYNDPPNVLSVALATGAKEINSIVDATSYNTSSRVRRPNVGEIIVWQNSAGYYLATKLEKVAARGYGSNLDEVVFSYVIAPTKSASFAP